MKHRFFLIAVSLLLALPAAAENEFDARVLQVADGDSVRVVDGHGRQRSLRLADIDAPELQQAEGIACRNALRDRLQRQTVRVRVLERDQYNREVARLFQGNTDINLDAIARGCAWHYRSVARQRGDAATYAMYERAEQQAKSGRSGLWRHANPTPPWRFRRGNRRPS